MGRAEGGRAAARGGGDAAPRVCHPAGPEADEYATYCLVTLLASNGARSSDPPP